MTNFVRPTVAATPGRTSFGNLLGWDPFRDLFPNWTQISGLEIARTETGYSIEVPVAGFRPEDISVTIEDQAITITGSSERRKFTRSLVLPDEIDADRVEAHVEHGLLTLSLPLHPKAQPKKIEVKRGDSAPAASNAVSVSNN
jgi:HSP20 family protein